MLLALHIGHMLLLQLLQNFFRRKKNVWVVDGKRSESAEKVLHSSEKPFTAIIGGAKVSDKILIIENLLEKATDIIIGGGMAYTFFKAVGGKIGNSLCEDDRVDTAKELLTKRRKKVLYSFTSRFYHCG